MRLGNAATKQLQLDIYGALIDSVYLYDKWGQPISSDHWDEVGAVVDWLCDHWDQPDEGIWETRGGRRNFVYSRLMCWVAIERAIRMANRRGLPADIPAGVGTGTRSTGRSCDRAGRPSAGRSPKGLATTYSMLPC